MECLAVRAGWLQFINQRVDNGRASTKQDLFGWVEAYQRAVRQGRVADLRLLHRPIDHRRWGQSPWLNYWQVLQSGFVS